MTMKTAVGAAAAAALAAVSGLAGASGLGEFGSGVSFKDVRAQASLMAPVPGRALPMAPAAPRAGDAAQRTNIWLDSWNRWSRLPNCGGTVELKIVNGQANVIFRDVENCSNFDILRTNGEFTDYGNKKLGGADRRRSGSFTIPKRFIDRGYNGIQVALQSNSKKTRDLIRIEFWAW